VDELFKWLPWPSYLGQYCRFRRWWRSFQNCLHIVTEQHYSRRVTVVSTKSSHKRNVLDNTVPYCTVVLHPSYYSVKILYTDQGYFILVGGPMKFTLLYCTGGRRCNLVLFWVELKLFFWSPKKITSHLRAGLLLLLPGWNQGTPCVPFALPKSTRVGYFCSTGPKVLVLLWSREIMRYLEKLRKPHVSHCPCRWQSKRYRQCWSVIHNLLLLSQ